MAASVLMNIWVILKKFKEELPGKEMFYSSLTNRKIKDKNMNMFLMFEINLKWKQGKIITTCI